MTDILQEWLALPAALGQTDSDRLNAHGVTHDALTRCGYLVPACVRIDDNLFEFDADGERTFIQPVFVGPIPSLYEAVDDPVLADLIAWHVEKPDTWYWRSGEHGMVLGDDALSRAGHFQEPLRLFSTPLEWLRGGGRGACLLDNRSNDRLRRVGGIVADTYEHGLRIEQMLKERTAPAPSISFVGRRAS